MFNLFISRFLHKSKSVSINKRSYFIKKSLIPLFTKQKFHDDKMEPQIEYLKIIETSAPREIAYRKSSGPRNNGIIYIPGFMSNMSGIKAASLEAFCKKYGFPYVRYDATGLGDSKSIRLEDARLTHWIEDAQQVLQKLTDRPQIVIGSSMGAWISLYLAQKYPAYFKGIVLLAPGVNFVERFSSKFTEELPDSVLKKLQSGEVFQFPHKEYGTFPVSYALAEDMIQYKLELEQGLNVTCPIRIIHGLKDADVPYEECLQIVHSLRSDDVELTYIKNGQHRLSEDDNLELIYDIILQLDAKLAKKNS